MEKQLHRNVQLLRLNSILMGLVAVVAPTMVLFQMKTLGLSLGEIFLGEAIFALTILSFEIPSGMLADRLGRRKMLFWAEALAVLAFTVLALAQNFTHIILCQVLAGVCMAMASGAKEALLFDTLKALKQEKAYRLVWSRMQSLVYGFAIVGSVTAGLAAAGWGLRAPTVLAVVVLYVSLVNLMFLVEPPQHVERPGEPPKKIRLVKSVRYVWKHAMVRNVVLFSMVMAVAMKLSFQTLNPYWDLMGVPVVLFGVALAFHNVIAMVVSYYAESLTKNRADYLVLGWLLLIVCGTYLLMASGVNWGVVGVIVLTGFFQISRGLWTLVTSDAVNQVTYSHHRATVLSIKSFAQQGAQAALLPVFGYLADWWGLLTAFGLLAWFLLVLGLLTLWPLRKI